MEPAWGTGGRTATAAPPADPDAEWVRQAAAGDSGAFEQLYRRHVKRVHGLCWRLSGNAAQADQATQDAFVRAWEKLGTFRFESLFSTWLHRLTVHVVLGEQRLLRRWVTFEESTGEGVDEDGADDGTAERPHERTGDRMDLERALAKLPKGARTVLLLHDVEGYRHEEIAEMTGIATGTSKAQLHRARKLMKEHLQ